MALSDDDRDEIAEVVRAELRSLVVHVEVGDAAEQTPRPDDTTVATPGEPERAAGGRGGLGFSPHALCGGLLLGALFCCSAFDLAAHAAPEPYTYPRSSYWLLVLALLAGAATVVTGLVDQRGLDPASALATKGRRHQVASYAGLALAVVSFLLRRRTDFIDEVPPGIVALTLVAFALVVAGWILGSRMRTDTP